MAGATTLQSVRRVVKLNLLLVARKRMLTGNFLVNLRHWFETRFAEMKSFRRPNQVQFDFFLRGSIRCH